MTIELICPSCEARYQVPETSIAEKGRQVSCMNCGHSWHAFPPLILGSSAAPPTAASPGNDHQSPPRPDRSPAAFAPGEADAPPPPSAPAAPGVSSVAPSAPSSAASAAASAGTSAQPLRAPEPARGVETSRSGQLAEIREMLAEVQSEERAAAALTPDGDDNRARVAPGPQPRPSPGASTMPASPPIVTEAPPRREPLGLDDADDDESDGSDPLRRRMAMHAQGSDKKRTDVERLRRRHDRRHKRAREAGSGAFFTGFLLVVMIAAAMTALYILQPQIVARMPGAEPMLNDYVAMVDSMRVSVAEGYQSVRDWVLDLIEKNT